MLSDTRKSCYHGVFADDSCVIPMVDINSSSVVILFRCSNGYIWTARIEDKCVSVKSQHRHERVHKWQFVFVSVYKSFHKPVYFPLASAWETNCYSKTLNRQLSVVSGHKNLCNLWERGNKAIKRWQENWNSISLSHFHSTSIYKLSFYNQNTSMSCGNKAKMVKKNGNLFKKYHTIMNSLFISRIKQVIC